MTRIDTKEFWRKPVPEMVDNPRHLDWYKPEFYIQWGKRIELVVQELSAHIDKDASILELGCGAGHNLVALKQAGFTNLSGIEINPDAIALGMERLDLTGITITCSAIEDANLPTVDCIFTHGVLMHMPPTAVRVFGRIAQAAQQAIITIENEFITGKLQWARNYQQVFEKLGWTELHSYATADWPPNTRLNILRLFTHE